VELRDTMRTAQAVQRICVTSGSGTATRRLSTPGGADCGGAKDVRTSGCEHAGWIGGVLAYAP